MFPGSNLEMHALLHSMLLRRRLLPETVSLHPLPGDSADPRLLLPQAAAVRPLRTDVVLSGRLLPQAVSAVLLARESRMLSLCAVQ